MDKDLEQIICLKFCIANGITRAESLKMLKNAYGELTLSKTRAYKWYRVFKSGRHVVEDLPCSDQPLNSSTSSNEVNMSKVNEMETVNNQEVAADRSMSHKSTRTSDDKDRMK